MKYLLDSNIIIYYLNGDENIHFFIKENHHICAISFISYYEVLTYDFSHEEELAVRKFLDGFEILFISKNIVNKAIENRKIKKIKIADNFILATAQAYSLDIVTRNTKDFTSFTKNIINPFDY